MLTVPPALLNDLQLRPGAKVRIAVESGRLVVEPERPSRYTMEALSRNAIKAERDKADTEWLDSKAAGREIL